MQVIHQPRAIITEAVPNKTAPGVAPQLLERQLSAGVTLREVFGVLHRFQHAIDAPHPTVIATMEISNRRALLHQSQRAMLADVVEGSDGTILLLGTDHRLPHEVVHDKVAGLLELYQAPGHMPDLGPHVIPLLLRELLGVVAITRDRISPEQRGVPTIHRVRVDGYVQNGDFELRFVHVSHALFY